MTTAVLTITGLNKTFGKNGSAVHANIDVDLTAHAGQVVCLLGHNGAGKTTLVNQVIGLTLPDAGTVMLDGVNAVEEAAIARTLASVQAQTNAPITGLTPRKAIELVGRLRGLTKRESIARAAYLLDALKLDPWADKNTEKVSGGVARLTAFAMAVVAPGKLVVLDEPTNDVDPVRRRLLWQEIRRIADDGAAILLVTHNIHEAEHVVDYVVLLDEGRVVTRGTPRELVERHEGDNLESVYINLVGDGETTSPEDADYLLGLEDVTTAALPEAQPVA
ncbi:MAG: ABC transporter ATP-binding protein [Promicromonosporaceae bacterium]|nr:ABC transporter ATP-binding protein [Promicromonosporaceae bacterium]